MPTPQITTAQRRARLVARHHLGRDAPGVLGAVRALVACHSSDPVTPYLTMWARVPNFVTDDLGHELHDARSLWRLHAMRRTLFVVPAEDGSRFQAAVARSIAATERRRLEGWLAAEIGADAVPRWLADTESAVLTALADGGEWRTADLTAAIPPLGQQITLGTGRWATRSRMSSRLLFLMAMDGVVVRTRPTGTWRSSQYRWAATAAWFGTEPAPMDPAEARAALAHHYLAAHGPATSADVRWWTGWTVTQTVAALEDVGAEMVRLDDGADGYVLADDVDAPPGPDGRVALLGGLDPTPMGWKERDWYVGGHADQLFDTGNVGPTVWVDGRIVGGWGQRPDGKVVYRLLEDVTAEAREAIDAEAAALTEWLDGHQVSTRFRTPLERALSG